MTHAMPPPWKPGSSPARPARKRHGLATAHRILRRVSILSTALALCACVTTGAPQRGRDDARAELNAQFNQISLMLPGQYGNYEQFHSREQTAVNTSATTKTVPPPLLSLSITPMEDLSNQLDYLVEQRARDAKTGSRAFLWRLMILNNALVLRIVPRDRSDAAPCEIRLTAITGGYAGQSEPGQCAPGGAAEQQLGLLKKIVIEPGRISLSDQVVYLDTRQVRLESQLEFQRIKPFSGWAGVRDDAGEWRLAQAFTLHNDGDEVSLLGRDGEPLGLRLQLARIRYREDRDPILRLALWREQRNVAAAGVGAQGTGETDDAGTETVARWQMVGYAWADPTARQIGLNLDWFQAGLQVAQE